MLPIIDVLNVPFGYIDNCLVRVFGKDLDNKENVNTAFKNSDSLENLKLSAGNQALLITSTSQETGEIQNIYSVHLMEMRILSIYHFLPKF